MSKNINVNPDHYKVAGRERQGEQVIHEVEKREIKRQRRDEKRVRNQERRIEVPKQPRASAASRRQMPPKSAGGRSTTKRKRS
jgi:hypothetical protein